MSFRLLSMMGNELFRRFRSPRSVITVLFLGIVITACSTVAQSIPTEPKASIQAELSTVEVTDGGVVLVTVKVPTGVKDNEVSGSFGDIQIPFFPASTLGEGVYQGVLGVPYNHKAGVAEVSLRFGEFEPVRLPLTVMSGNYTVETLTVDPRKVNPKPRDMVRIKRDIVEVGAIYSRVTKEKYWAGPFIFPISSEITSPYGNRRVFNGEMRSFHGGLDLRAKVGTPVHAAAGGVVALTKDLFFSGKTVMIDHGYGVITLYAHLDKMSVKKGQKVETGALIGISGQTGRVSGPHLHWQAVIHKTKVNPLDLTRVMR